MVNPYPVRRHVMTDVEVPLNAPGMAYVNGDNQHAIAVARAVIGDPNVTEESHVKILARALLRAVGA